MQSLLCAIAAMESSQDARRIFHGRGGLHPGCEHLSLDVYPPVFVLTSFQILSDDELHLIGSALDARWKQISPDQGLNWVYQCRAEASVGMRAETRLMVGSVPDPHVVSEGDSNYLVHVLKGQNHGLFLDMAEGRRWVREHVAARANVRVLNLFAYTCAFSVVAMQAGARSVVNIDMSHAAIRIGQQNHQRNGITSGASFLPHDLFSSWGKVSRGGPYDLIIVDPPSYQKGSFVATKDYARLIRRMDELLMHGGYLLLCLNAPELGVSFLHDQMKEFAPGFTFIQRLENPPEFADTSEDRSLKVLVYRSPTLVES